MPVLPELIALIAAFLLAAISLIESPKSKLAWAVLILTVLALYPRVL